MSSELVWRFVNGWPGGSAGLLWEESMRVRNSKYVGTRQPWRLPTARPRHGSKSSRMRSSDGLFSQTRPVSRSSTALLPKFASTTNRGQFDDVVHASV